MQFFQLKGGCNDFFLIYECNEVKPSSNILMKRKFRTLVKAKSCSDLQVWLLQLPNLALSQQATNMMLHVGMTIGAADLVPCVSCTKAPHHCLRSPAFTFVRQRTQRCGQRVVVCVYLSMLASYGFVLQAARTPESCMCSKRYAVLGSVLPAVSSGYKRLVI